MIVTKDLWGTLAGKIGNIHIRPSQNKQRHNAMSKYNLRADVVENIVFKVDIYIN